MTSSVYRIRLTFRGKTGYSLYCDACFSGDVTDVLLADGGKVLVFSSLDALHTFVASGQPSNIEATEAYLAYRASFIHDGSAAPVRDAHAYDLDAMSASLTNRRWSAIDLSERSDILDALNLIWDVGCTLDITIILDCMYRSDELNLCTLMDVLTRNPQDMQRFERRHIARFLDQLTMVTDALWQHLDWR